jgi:cold shock CspA family protein
VVEALKFVNEHYGMFRATRSWDRLRIALQPFESLREAKDLLGRIGPVVSVPNDGRTGGIEVVRRGTIVNLRDTYGFIGHPDYATNLFFHFGSLGATTLKTEVTVGSEVEFTVYEDESGRVRARNVSQLIR